MNWYQGACLPPILIGLLHNVHLFSFWNDLQLRKTVNKNIRKVTKEHEELSKIQHVKRQITAHALDCERIASVYNQQIRNRPCL